MAALSTESTKPYYLVEHQIQLQQVVQRFLQRGTRIYADTETTGLNPRKNKLVMLQIMQDGGCPVIIDCRNFPDGWGSVLKPLAESLLWVGHNFSGFDWAVLANNGIHVKRVFDTQIAQQLIQSSGLSGDGLSLADVVAKYAGVLLDKTSREWFFSPAPLDERPEWAERFPDEELEYGAKDVLYLPTVFKAQCSELLKRDLMPIMQLEMAALPAIAQVRLNGIHIDVDGWRDFIAHKAEEAKEYEAALFASKLGKAMLQCRTAAYDKAMETHAAWEAARDEYVAQLRVRWELNPSDGFDEPLKWGDFKNTLMKMWRELNPNPGKPHADTREVNFGSSKQLMETFTHLGIPIPTKRDKKTGETKQTVDAESIEKLAGEHPVLKPLLKFRKAEKFVDAFGEKLLARVEDDGRIHAQYNQLGAETGRMSCEAPNWQQIPSRGDGKKLRANVTASEGHVLLTSDLPNIELRILADLSGDTNMLDMFASGEDLHSFTARKMFGIPEGEDPKTFEWKPGLKARELAKTTNFGVAYGQSYMGLAAKFNLPEDEAKRIIGMWDELYAGAREWLTRQGDLALARRYSTTAAGRKRFYELPPKPDMRNRWSEEAKAYRKAEGSIRRQAMNFPMQGLCVDIVKAAVAEYHERTQHGRIVAIVHDEIVVEVPTGHAESEATLLSEVMGNACRRWLKRVDIPEIEVNVGERWEKI